MPRIGYARVSTSSQDLDVQKATLRAAGCEIIRAETGSGASRDGRSELFGDRDAVLAKLRPVPAARPAPAVPPPGEPGAPRAIAETKTGS